MLLALLLTALWMGLMGGPHCLVMCAAPCAMIAKTAGKQSTRAWMIFQMGRVVGYAALGAVAALSIQWIGDLSVHQVALRHLWSLFHVLAMMLGVVLMWKAQQPLFFIRGSRWVWQKIMPNHRPTQTQLHLIFLTGALWTFLPCGLLYSVLMVAALTGQAWQGAVVMGVFALSSSVFLLIGPVAWSKLQSYAVWGQPADTWGVRLAGLLLFVFSALALWHALINNQAPWCVQ